MPPGDLQHFRPKGFGNWLQNRKRGLLLGSGFVMALYFWNLETVPYSKRTRLVLVPKTCEKWLAEQAFELLGYKEKVLHPMHPKSIRVRLIAKNITDALQRGLTETEVGEHEKSKHKGYPKGYAAYLEGLNWEVLVVDEPHVNAGCLPGGKIVVFTGLLEYPWTDAELATILGHEIGHAIARHGAEILTRMIWPFIILIILLYFDLIFTDDMSHLFLDLHHSRMKELEADYIGLLLMASAGYDPRVAPRVYKKLYKICGYDLGSSDDLSTHPSGKKRVESLTEDKFMEEALSIYRSRKPKAGLRRHA